MKIFKLFNTLFANDKLLHFFWSTILLLLLDFLFNDLISYIILISVAGAKEIVWDWLMKKGSQSLLDFLFGIAPIGIHLLLNYL